MHPCLPQRQAHVALQGLHHRVAHERGIAQVAHPRQRADAAARSAQSPAEQGEQQSHAEKRVSVLLTDGWCEAKNFHRFVTRFLAKAAGSRHMLNTA
jgi:hypothetical protein